MHTISVQQPINLKVVRFELDFTSLVNEKPISEKRPKKIKIPRINKRKQSLIPLPPLINNTSQKRDVSDLVEELLDELYAEQRDWGNQSAIDGSRGSFKSSGQKKMKRIASYSLTVLIVDSQNFSASCVMNSCLFSCCNRLKKGEIEC